MNDSKIKKDIVYAERRREIRFKARSPQTQQTLSNGLDRAINLKYEYMSIY